MIVLVFARPSSTGFWCQRARKTDVIDAQWLCRLAEAGRLHKILEDTGIKLDCVASDILGKSGRAMLHALIAGTTDPRILAELAQGKLRTKLPALREALHGRFDSEHVTIASRILAHIDYLDEAISDLSQTIEQQIAPLAAKVEALCTIPGVQRRTAEVIIAEIGADMSAFPTAKHLASWASICPGNDQSAGKRRSGKTRKGSKWLRANMIEAAKSASRTNNTYLQAQYKRLRARRGHAKATTAVAHSILIAAWHMLTSGQRYNDPGSDYFNRRDPKRTTRRLITQLEKLGHAVTLEPATATSGTAD